ncbi:unnamed protein product [Urochloa humidicola]
MENEKRKKKLRRGRSYTQIITFKQLLQTLHLHNIKSRLPRFNTTVTRKIIQEQYISQSKDRFTSQIHLYKSNKCISKKTGRGSSSAAPSPARAWAALAASARTGRAGTTPAALGRADHARPRWCRAGRARPRQDRVGMGWPRSLSPVPRWPRPPTPGPRRPRPPALGMGWPRPPAPGTRWPRRRPRWGRAGRTHLAHRRPTWFLLRPA